MVRKSIEKQIADLKFDAKIYAANQRRLTTQVKPSLKVMSNAQFRSLAQVSEGFEMLGLSIDEGLWLAMHNRLPEALQDHYGKMNGNPMTDDEDSDFGVMTDNGDSDTDADGKKDRRSVPLDELYPRWRPDHWRCSCGEHNTLWHKTPFEFKDRNQIYCATCHTLSGWGSDTAFKAAQTKGEAARIIITHPLDREAFKPPLIIRSPMKPKPTPIRAKQSQGRSSPKNPVRAKRSQSRTVTK